VSEYIRAATIVSLLSGVLFSGCASIGHKAPPSADDLSVEKIFNSKEESLKSSDFGFEGNFESIETLIFSMAAASDKPVFSKRNGTTEKQKALGALMIKASDDVCYAYLTDISTYEKGTKSVLGSAAILLSGAAGLATPVRSANLLSGISAATQGIEEELGSTILGGLEADILVQAVRKGRGRQRKALSDILNSNKADAGFNMFIAEFSTYHDSCGISYGRDVIRDALGSQDNNEKPSPGEVRSLSEQEDDTSSNIMIQK